jgi:hypothetical protein|tara:strand:+ start:38 stop:565 length:528 start_codon:yes stop_codon:yes gene_type:complete
MVCKEDLQCHPNLKTPFTTKGGNFITQALFLELSYNDTRYSIYTLDDDDKEFKGETYYSLKKLYLLCDDVTEYTFATTWLGGWQHWQRLLEKTTSLHPYIESWREELEVKLRSQGLLGVLESASNGNYNAQKYLTDKGWDTKRGRPSKEEVSGEKKKKAMIKSEVDEDAQRIGLH